MSINFIPPYREYTYEPPLEPPCEEEFEIDDIKTNPNGEFYDYD